MCEQEELEAHLQAVQLDFRRLWLEAENILGLVAETLAEATGWQPTDAEILPDALALAQVAAARINELESRVIAQQPPLKARRQREYA